MASHPRQFPIRQDVAPLRGYQTLDHDNTSPEGFVAFMLDRSADRLLKKSFRMAAALSQRLRRDAPQVTME